MRLLSITLVLQLLAVAAHAALGPASAGVHLVPDQQQLAEGGAPQLRRLQQSRQQATAVEAQEGTTPASEEDLLPVLASPRTASPSPAAAAASPKVRPVAQAAPAAPASGPKEPPTTRPVPAAAASREKEPSAEPEVTAAASKEQPVSAADSKEAPAGAPAPKASAQPAPVTTGASRAAPAPAPTTPTASTATTPAPKASGTRTTTPTATPSSSSSSSKAPSSPTAAAATTPARSTPAATKSSPSVTRPAPTCSDGKAPKMYAASSTRMCVLGSATDNEGLLWNAVGRQVSYTQAQACFVARCPEGMEPKIPGVGNSGIVTTRSAQQQPGAAAAAGPDRTSGPSVVVIERGGTETGRKLRAAAGVRAQRAASKVDEDVITLMNFAAVCFTVCE